MQPRSDDLKHELEVRHPAFLTTKKPSNNNNKLRLNNDSQRSIKQLNVSFRSFRPKFGKLLQLRRDTQRSPQTQSHKMLNRACILSLNPSEAMSPVLAQPRRRLPSWENRFIAIYASWLCRSRGNSQDRNEGNRNT
jgi:hypothetical protein